MRGRKPFSENTAAKILASSFILAFLVIMLGARLSLSERQATESPIEIEAVREAPAPADATADDEPADFGSLLTVNPEHEAAAGPQPESPAVQDQNVEPLQEKVPPLHRVGIQAGHWKTAEAPDELARLRNSTGTSGGGVAEWELNLDIAKRVVPLLEARGLVVDVLSTTIPPAYKADAFIALHADGDSSGQMSGFKLARARTSSIPEADDALLAAISKEYQAATGLSIDPSVSRNMTGYYAFPFRRFKNSIAPTTPGVILEMGFLTNASDRKIILDQRKAVAEGIARGILRFLKPI